MTSCPDCGTGDPKALGIEHGKSMGDNCTILVTRYRCKECCCEFREFMVTHWHLEVTRHDPIELMFMEATE
jgi:hypothetical protein